MVGYGEMKDDLNLQTFGETLEKLIANGVVVARVCNIYQQIREKRPDCCKDVNPNCSDCPIARAIHEELERKKGAMTTIEAGAITSETADWRIVHKSTADGGVVGFFPSRISWLNLV